MFEAQLLIAGEERAATANATFEHRGPTGTSTVTRAARATVEDARAAVDAANAAFPAWSKLEPSARRAQLSAAARLLRERAGAFVERLSAETGGTAGWGQFNVHIAALMLEEAAALTTQVSGEVIPSNQPGTLALAVRVPAGVTLGMAPWNAPIILGVRAIATPLACGNTVVLKASEVCPATHALIGVIMRDAGLPAGVVNVVTHAAEDAPAIVEAMIAHPAVRRVNFTGSTRVGRIIGRLAGQHLKPAVLELGGKAPLVVLDDADIDAAVDAAVFGAFMHQGQICMSTERIVVDEAIADAFVSKLGARAKALKVGKDGPIGAVVNAATIERVTSLLDDAVRRGGKLICGGTHDGVFMAPTVVDRVTREMKLYGEESFGPIVGITRVKGDEQAVAVANDTEYGLSAAVFGRDLSRAIAVARRIDSGMCHINSPTVQDEPQLPFGGVKASGFGRFGGRAGVHEFTELRWLSIATEPRHYPF
jgi:benzaldehyde dehydrogenase (NAD)